MNATDPHPAAEHSVHPGQDHVWSKSMPHDRTHTYRYCLRTGCGATDVREAKA